MFLHFRYAYTDTVYGISGTVRCRNPSLVVRRGWYDYNWQHFFVLSTVENPLFIKSFCFTRVARFHGGDTVQTMKQVKVIVDK